MNFKVVLAVSICTAIPMVANAQQNRPAANAPKPTVADVQKLVQMGRIKHQLFRLGQASRRRSPALRS